MPTLKIYYAGPVYTLYQLKNHLDNAVQLMGVGFLVVDHLCDQIINAFDPEQLTHFDELMSWDFMQMLATRPTPSPELLTQLSQKYGCDPDLMQIVHDTVLEIIDNSNQTLLEQIPLIRTTNAILIDNYRLDHSEFLIADIAQELQIPLISTADVFTLIHQFTTPAVPDHNHR